MMYPGKPIMVNPEKPQLGKILALDGDYVYVEVEKRPKGVKVQKRHVLTGKVLDTREGYVTLERREFHLSWFKGCKLVLCKETSYGALERFSSKVPAQLCRVLESLERKMAAELWETLKLAVSELEKQEDERIQGLTLSATQERTLLGMLDSSLKGKRLFQGLKDLGREDLAELTTWETPFLRDEFIRYQDKQITVEEFLAMITG